MSSTGPTSTTSAPLPGCWGRRRASRYGPTFWSGQAGTQRLAPGQEGALCCCLLLFFSSSLLQTARRSVLHQRFGKLGGVI